MRWSISSGASLESSSPEIDPAQLLSQPLASLVIRDESEAPATTSRYAILKLWTICFTIANFMLSWLRPTTLLVVFFESPILVWYSWVSDSAGGLRKMDLAVEQGDQNLGGEGHMIINVVRTSLVLLLKYF